MSLLDAVQLQRRFNRITFLLHYKGRLSRSELVMVLGCGEATASRAINSYLEAYPNSMELVSTRSGYRALSPPAVDKQSATEGLRYVAFGEIQQSFVSDLYGYKPESLNASLNAQVTGVITSAICGVTAIQIEYASGNSGTTFRQVWPHSIFRSADVWYYRAYDDYRSEFRTFRFSRTVEASAVEAGVSVPEKKSIRADDEWNRLRGLQIAPHPSLDKKDAIFSDLGVGIGEFRTLVAKEACVGFVLNEMRVDCSAGSRLNHNEFPLVLLNVNEMNSVDSMVLAPGWQPKIK